jgi:hypothetical protein
MTTTLTTTTTVATTSKRLGLALIFEFDLVVQSKTASSYYNGAGVSDCALLGSSNEGMMMINPSGCLPLRYALHRAFN